MASPSSHFSPKLSTSFYFSILSVGFTFILNSSSGFSSPFSTLENVSNSFSTDDYFHLSGLTIDSFISSFTVVKLFSSFIDSLLTLLSVTITFFSLFSLSLSQLLYLLLYLI